MFNIILTIGCDPSKILKKKYNTIGNHKCSIYGKYIHSLSNSENYWVDFYNLLDGYQYNVIFFDIYSRYWLDKLNPNVFITCMEILYASLDKNGIIITEAYNINTKEKYKISAFLSKISKLQKKIIKFPNSTNLYYIFSHSENLNTQLKYIEDIYPHDFKAVTIKPLQKINKETTNLIWNISSVSETDPYQFLENRLYLT